MTARESVCCPSASALFRQASGRTKMADTGTTAAPNRTIVILLGVIVLLLLAIIGYMAFGGGAKQTASTDTTGTTAATTTGTTGTSATAAAFDPATATKV